METNQNSPLYFEITRDEMKPNRIIKYEVVYEEHLDPMKESFELPALQEIDSHVNDVGLFIEMTKYIPVRLAWWKLSINQLNSQWYQAKYYSWDQIRSLPLSRTTNFWGKPFFFSLLRILWDKYYFELSATDHEIIRKTKIIKQFQIKSLC